MKHCLFFLAVVFLISCNKGNKKLEEKNLIGTWVSVHNTDEPGEQLAEKTTIFPGRSLETQFYIKGQLQRTVRLTYQIDAERNLLILSGEGHTMQVKVVKLTQQTLVLEFTHSGVKRTLKRQ